MVVQRRDSTYPLGFPGTLCKGKLQHHQPLYHNHHDYNLPEQVCRMRRFFGVAFNNLSLHCFWKFKYKQLDKRARVHNIQHETIVLTVLIGFPMGFLLISKFGVIGLIVSSLNSQSSKLIHKLTIHQKTVRSIGRLGIFRQNSVFFSNNRNLDLRSYLSTGFFQSRYVSYRV